MAQSLNNGLMRPARFPVPALVGGVEKKINHGLGMPYYYAKVYNLIEKNDAQMYQFYPDPANPTTHFCVKSIVDIPSDTLELQLIGYYDL